jgi:hypothetical protein
VSRNIVLDPEVVLKELKGKLPKPNAFQSTIGLRSKSNGMEHRDDLFPEEKVAWYGWNIGTIYLPKKKWLGWTSTPSLSRISTTSTTSLYPLNFSTGVNSFDLVTLKFDPLFKNFNIGHVF